MRDPKVDFAESRLRTAENDCSLTTTEIGPEPSFNVVKIRLSELVEEKRDTNPIECLRDGNNRRAHWEFRLLQTPGGVERPPCGLAAAKLLFPPPSLTLPSKHVVSKKEAP